MDHSAPYHPPSMNQHKDENPYPTLKYYQGGEQYRRQQSRQQQQQQQSKHQGFRTFESVLYDRPNKGGVGLISNTNLAFLIAILVIVYFQRKDAFRWDSWNKTVDWFLEMHEYARAYCQMGLEVLRNFRESIWSPHGEDWVGTEHFFTDQGIDFSPSTGADELYRTSPPSQLPDLEVRNSGKDVSRASKQSMSKQQNTELEPAFLRDEDYPPGWLVYHPRLGVVSKADADFFDQEGMLPHEKKRKAKNPPPPQQDQEPQIPQQEEQLDTPEQLQSQQSLQKDPPTRSPSRHKGLVSPNTPLRSPPSIAANG